MLSGLPNDGHQRIMKDFVLDKILWFSELGSRKWYPKDSVIY